MYFHWPDSSGMAASRRQVRNMRLIQMMLQQLWNCSLSAVDTSSCESATGRLLNTSRRMENTERYTSHSFFLGRELERREPRLFILNDLNYYNKELSEKTSLHKMYARYTGKCEHSQVLTHMQYRSITVLSCKYILHAILYVRAVQCVCEQSSVLEKTGKSCTRDLSQLGHWSLITECVPVWKQSTT